VYQYRCKRVQEDDEQEEVKGTTPEGQRREPALAPGPARVLPSGPRVALAATSTPHNDATPGGAGPSGLNQKYEEEEEEEEEEEDTLGQLEIDWGWAAGDRLGLAPGTVRVPAPGARAARVFSKVEDSTIRDDTDGEGEEEEGPGEQGCDGEGDGEGGEGGLELLAGAAHVPGDDRGGEGAPRRSTPADRAARVKRGRGDVAADDVVPEVPAPKRRSGGACVGPSGRHGVHERTGRDIGKATPWLKWCAELSLPGAKTLGLGLFPAVDDAARAYDAEVRRRGWAHVRALNFPQPEELVAYAQAVERCDERSLPLSLAPEPPAAAQGAATVQDGSGQRQPKLSGHEPGKSGFFGVSRSTRKKKTANWQADMCVPGAENNYYVLGGGLQSSTARLITSGFCGIPWVVDGV